MHRYLMLPLIWLFQWGIITAQNPVTTELSLSDALDKTMNNNQQIKVADYEYMSAQVDVEKMKSLYLPQIEASATGSANNLPLQAFGTKLQQGAIQQSDFIPASLNSPSSITNLQTQLMVRQPLINLDAKAMKGALIAKSNAFSQQVVRTKKVLRFHVAQAYLQLQLTYNMVEVLKQAKKTAEANLKLTRDNMAAGYVQNADVLFVEVRVNEIENQLFQTKSNIQNISDQLSFLMGESYGQQYMPTDELKDANQSNILIEKIPTTRSDVKAMELQINAHQQMLVAAQKANFPRVNAFGSYELNNNLDFGDAQHGYLVGIQASWMVFNGNKNKSAVNKAKIEIEKAHIQLNQLIAQNNLEFEMAKRKMLEARNKIILTEKSIEQSKESLRIKTDRYAEGLEKTTDILMAETQVSQKEMEYIEAVYQYQLAYSQILLILEKI